MLLMDKTGEKKLMSFVWIFVIAIVVAGIGYGVSVFYSAEVDVRNVEAEILMDRISDCFFEQGFLIEGLLEDDFDIFHECKLNRDVIESDFYFKIAVLDNLGNKIREDIREGKNFEVECGVVEGEETEARYFPECVWKERTIIYEQDDKIKKGRLEILTASNQVGEKISLIG